MIPVSDYSEFSLVLRKAQGPSVSWWADPSLSWEAFHARAEIEFARMAQMAGDPVVQSIRPMVLGGKLP